MKKKKQTATKQPAPEIKPTAVLPYVKGLSEALRRCLQQQGIRTVFRSDTTLRSQLVRHKDTVDPAKQDGVVYKIPCECGKVYIGETGISMHERTQECHMAQKVITCPILGQFVSNLDTKQIFERSTQWKNKILFPSYIRHD